MAEAPDPEGMDRLTKQLHYIPFIIGRMGINIAEAQQMLNADYVRTLRRLLVLIQAATKQDAGGSAEPKPDPALMTTILKSLAPSRYQFTESTLEFSADLAESMDLGVSLGLGAGFSGFTINASMAIGYGYDYRSAARVTSVLHAIPSDTEFGETLLQSAAAIRDGKIELGSGSGVDDAIWEELDKLRQITGGSEMGDPPKKPA